MNTAFAMKEGTSVAKRRLPSHKRIYSIFFSEIFFIISFVYIETVFHISVFENMMLTYPIIFAVPAGALCGVICDLFPEKAAKILRYRGMELSGTQGWPCGLQGR